MITFNGKPIENYIYKDFEIIEVEVIHRYRRPRLRHKSRGRSGPCKRRIDLEISLTFEQMNTILKQMLKDLS